MRLTKLQLVAAATLVAALSIAVVAPAGAEKRILQVTTEVRFLEVNRTTFLDFSGKIGARKPCRDDRDVTLWYRQTKTSAPQKLGTADTDRKGAFLIDLASPAIMGLYTVSVSKDVEKEIRGGDIVRFVCKAARPPYLHF